MLAESIRSNTIKALGSILGCLAILLLFTCPASGQIEDLFDSASFVGNLKSRYRLTSRDLFLLRPMIREQNEVLLTALSKHLDADNGNYMSLWDDIRRKRSEFEISIPKGLTSRQKIALQAARTEAEGKIADEWRDNYLYMLEESLELDLFQMNYVSRVFAIEQEQRLHLLTFGNSDLKRTDRSWQSASDEREKRLRLIFTPEQLSTYQRMNDLPGRFIA